MDLREYDYFTLRPDTFLKSDLQNIRTILAHSHFSTTTLIDRVLAEGYLEPPEEYEYDGCYLVKLSIPERNLVLKDLKTSVENLTKQRSLNKKQQDNLNRHIHFWSRSITKQPISYEEHKSNQTYFDLRNASLEQLQEFIFNHPIVGLQEGDGPWYFDFNIWIDCEDSYVKDLYIKLFHESETLLNKYSIAELEQGMWALMGPNLERSPYYLIWDSDSKLNLSEKVELIHSMLFLYKNLFSTDLLDTSCNMWWDSFAYDYCVDGLTDPENSEQDKVIQNAMFETLEKILYLESEECQYAALHGLGHLRHPQTEKLITDFMKQNQSITDNMITYANACIKGDII